MNIAEKKNLCRQLIETVWNQGKVDELDKFVTPGHQYTDKSTSFQQPGPVDLKKYVLAFRTAFPDLNCKIDDQIAEGDKVVTIMTVSATHEGDFMGFAPSHKKASVPTIVVQRFEGDKIAEGFGLWDLTIFLRAVGALELPEAAMAAR